MNRQKLLIADVGDEFRLALAEYTADTFVVRTCQEGREALQTILSFQPDVLVLDMMLPGLDGVSILQAAADADIRPVVLATTKFASDYLAESAQRLGVEYMMVKPCDVKATASRLKELVERRNVPASAGPDPRNAVSNVLLSLGISVKLRGYAYLREAILETMRCPGQMVTKELYPKVGKLCDGTVVQVERSIRSAITKAWSKRDEDLWSLYFQKGPSGALERPTNAVFISAVAERMMMDGVQIV